MYTFLLRMTDTVTSQNIDLTSWDILYITGKLFRIDAEKNETNIMPNTFPLLAHAFAMKM
jgi:hypothetical protein